VVSFCFFLEKSLLEAFFLCFFSGSDGFLRAEGVQFLRRSGDSTTNQHPFFCFLFQDIWNANPNDKLKPKEKKERKKRNK